MNSPQNLNPLKLSAWRNFFVLVALVNLILFDAKAGSIVDSKLVHPLEISQDGQRLYAVNSAEGRLSVFSLSGQRKDWPLLIAEIPVGLSPVTVRLENEQRAWVVNELSDTLSIVDLTKQVTVATLATGDEPSDLTFANGKAFVTCLRDNCVQVFNTTTLELLATIPLEGIGPRSIVASSDGSKLYVGFLFTSNGTTMLDKRIAPPQEVPEWANPNLPAPPSASQIVPIDHPDINFTIVDHDLAIIDALNHEILGYRGNLGTNIFNLAALPDGRVLALNSEARNLIKFEPQLRGRFILSRLAEVTEIDETQTLLHDHPDLHFPIAAPGAGDFALAQAKELVITPDAAYAWIAGFGSDRLARLDLTNFTLDQWVDLRGLDDPDAPRSADTVRGPRGLALHPEGDRLYSMNKLSHTLSVIALPAPTNQLNAATPLGEVSLAAFRDLEPRLKLGRGFLYDARLSAAGTASCASCHIDNDRDGMAWDLGDPTGEMLTVQGTMRSLHLYNTVINHQLHPMKGPFMTQTLLGLSDQTKLHWRGDKPSIEAFNSTFPKLLGADPLAAEEIGALADFLRGLKHHPNPYQKLDRNLPLEIQGGDPNAGIAIFAQFENHCMECHTLPSGTSNNLDIINTAGARQPMKDAPLRTTYQRMYYNPTPGGTSLSPYGLLSDGTGHELPIVHPYSLHILDDISRPAAIRNKEIKDLTAFMLGFDTGTPPAIGHTLTFTGGQAPTTAQQTELNTLITRASLGQFRDINLIAHAQIDGQSHTLIYSSAHEGFVLQNAQIEPPIVISPDQILEKLSHGDTISMIGVPPTEPFLAARVNAPTPNLAIDRLAPPGLSSSSEQQPRVLWPMGHHDWFLETSTNLQNWQPAPQLPTETEANYQQVLPADGDSNFFRLRRTW